eukprot:1138728-Pelagomonas_calceolata.AAC.6
MVHVAEGKLQDLPPAGPAPLVQNPLPLKPFKIPKPEQQGTHQPSGVCVCEREREREHDVVHGTAPHDGCLWHILPSVVAIRVGRMGHEEGHDGSSGGP